MSRILAIPVGVILAVVLLRGVTGAEVIEEHLDKCDEETPYSSDGETCKSHKIENPSSNPPLSSHSVTIHWSNETTTTATLGPGDSHTALCKATAIDVHETGPMGSPTLTKITVVEAGTP